MAGNTPKLRTAIQAVVTGPSEKMAQERAQQAQQDYLSRTEESRNWRPQSRANSRAAQTLSSTGSGASVARKALLGA